MKIDEVERVETEFKTIRKFQDRGSFRLQHRMYNFKSTSGWIILMATRKDFI